MVIGYKDKNGNIVQTKNVGSTIQVETMPTASASNLNFIYQYIGVTDVDYINGFFYKCVSNGQIPATYSWIQINVQANLNVIEGYRNPVNGLFYKENSYTAPIAGEANTEYIDLPNNKTYRWDGSTFVRLDEENEFQLDVMPVASADKLGKIYQYVGETGNGFVNGYFYKCISNGESPATYSWAEVKQPTTADSTKADLIDIAPTFTTSITYNIGQYVTYSGDIYRCIINHAAGTWDATHFTKVDIGSELNTIAESSSASIQKTTLPIASVTDVGKIYQYIGITSGAFEHGHFYECVLNGSTYEWKEIGVSDGDVIQFSVIPTASIDYIDRIIQYTGATNATYTNGVFYKCTSDGAVTPAYSWIVVRQPNDIRGEKVIATAADFRTAGQGAYSFKTSAAVTITLNDANTITIPANTQGFFDIGEIDTALNDYIGTIQYTYNGYEKTIYFNSSVFYVPATDSVQIDDTNASSATTYSSAKIETIIGSSKASQMTGATAYQDGKEGLVTKPVAGDNQKALFGDGRYHNIYAANTGSVVVAVTDEPDLYGQPVTLTAGSTTLNGTFSNTGECTFSNLALYGAVQIASEDAEHNPARGSTNITYFGTYVVGIGFNFATIKFTSTDILLAGTPVAIYFGNDIVAETSLRSTGYGSLEAICYVEQLGTYKAVAQTSDGTARASVKVTALRQTYTAELVAAEIYGFVLDHNDSNPATCVKAYDLTDYEVLNADFTPAYMDFTNDRFVWGSWTGNEFFFPKPCMLNYDGTVAYYLDPNDYSKKADGTASDVADMSYNGNVMVEFPTIYFKRWQDNDKSYCLIADKQLDADFHAWAHHDKNGNVLPYIYLAAYNGSYDGTRLRSISGIEYHNRGQLTVNKIMSNATRQQEIDFAQANNDVNEQGEGWYIRHKAEWDMVNDLLLLIGMNTDSQTTFGKGRDNSYSSISNVGIITTGTMNDKGMFWGKNDSSAGVKVFYIENWWANIWQSCAGWMNDYGTQKIKFTYGQEDGSTTTGYNTTGSGYITINNTTPSGSNGGYISSYITSEYGLMPKVLYGSQSTYLCDGVWYNNGQNNFALVGCASNASTSCGAFSVTLCDAPSEARWGLGTALSYKPLA